MKELQFFIIDKEHRNSIKNTHPRELKNMSLFLDLKENNNFCLTAKYVKIATLN